MKRAFMEYVARRQALTLVVVLAALGGGCGGGGDDDGGDIGSGPFGNSPRNITVSGAITFDFVPARVSQGLDYAGTEPRPARGVSVELVQGSTVLATTTTDAAGRYSFTATMNINVLVRARAEMLRSGTPSWDFQVVDNTKSDALFVLEGTTFNTGTTDVTRNLHAASGWDGSSYTGTRAAAPFAILDLVYDAVQLVLSANPSAAFPALRLHWSPDNRPTLDEGVPNLATGEIGTSFFAPELGIYLLGAADVDTEEYDRHVIAHEWGHYFEESFSRADSVGGPHTRGDQLDLRVAFGEGWGNAFSAMVTGQSVYRDVQGPRQGSAPGFDVEGPLSPLPQDQNPHPGWYSEESVQELLYDIYDGNVDRVGSSLVFDQVELGFEPIHTVLTGPQRSTLALTSIFSFINAMQAARPDQAPLIDELVRAQSIDTIVDDYGSSETNLGDRDETLAGNQPSPDLSEIYTDIAVNAPAPLNICSIDDFESPITGAVNKLGSRRFLRFTAVDGTHTFRATATDIPVEPGVDPGTVQADPDLVLHRAGPVHESEDGPPLSCSAAAPSQCFESFSRMLAAGEYILEVYEWTHTTSNPAYPPIGRTCFDVEIRQP